MSIGSYQQYRDQMNKAKPPSSLYTAYSGTSMVANYFPNSSVAASSASGALPSSFYLSGEETVESVIGTSIIVFYFETDRNGSSFLMFDFEQRWEKVETTDRFWVIFRHQGRALDDDMDFNLADLTLAAFEPEYKNDGDICSLSDSMGSSMGATEFSAYSCKANRLCNTICWLTRI